MTSLDFGAYSKLGISWAEFGLTWWLQSAILLLVGLVAAGWLRHRGPAIQSMICRATLVAVLCCPLVTHVLSLLGVSLLTIDLQSRLVPMPEAPAMSMVGPASADASFVPENSLSMLNQPDDVDPAGYELTNQLAGGERTHEEFTRGGATPAIPPVSVEPAAFRSAAVSEEPSTGISRALGAANGLLFVWTIGALCFAVCLLVDVFRGELLRRKSADGDAQADQVCRDVASLLHVRAPQVLANPFISSPCLLGHWRPAVLLPEETPATAFREVFLHELAHLRRGDWLWSLLGRITRSLLWCQPLLWILLRRDASAAEEVCDDYVLQFGGNRAGYLRQLVEIAERSLPRHAAAGVAMVSFQSKLGRRTRRILDTTRILSTGVGRWFACVALVATLVATASVATIYVGKPAPANAQDVLLAADESDKDDKGIDEEAELTTTNDPSDENDVIRVKGRVVDPDGKPVSEVAVYVAEYASVKPLQEAITDEQGNFEVEYDKSRFARLDWHAEPWRVGMIYVNMPGFGPAWATGDELASNPNVELRLARDDVPVRGQILDLEGRPIAGATIKIYSVAAGNNDDLGDVWQELNKYPTHAINYVGGRMRNFPSRLAGLAVTRGSNFSESEDPDRNRAIRTDEFGTFEFSGVGRGRIVGATVAGPSIQSTGIYVVTAPSIDEHWPPKELSESTRISLDIGHSMPQIYSAKFKHIANPSRPISGVVRDSETGEPIAGIAVSGDVRGAGDHAYGKTDQNGRYTLTGLATEGELRLYALPRPDDHGTILPYLGAERDSLKFSTSSPPAHTDFSLVRGVLVRGVLKDDGGQPVKGNVEYLGHGGNEFLQNMEDKLSPYESVNSDDDGNFQLIVPPGPGSLAVSAPLGKRDTTTQYQKAKAEDFGLPLDDERWVISTNMGYLAPDDYEAAQAINFSAGEEPVITIQLTRLTDFERVRFVDETGNRVESVKIAGRIPRRKSFDRYGNGNPVVQVLEVQKKGRRPIVASDYDGKVAVAIFAPDDPRTPHLSVFPKEERGIYSIKLQPAASIVGRLVDADGAPITKAKVNVALFSQPFDEQRLIEYPQVDVDANGAFLFKGLPATGPFVLAASCDEGKGVVRSNIQLSPGQVFDAGALDVPKAADVGEMTKLGPNFKVAVNPKAGAVYDVGDIANGTDLDEAATERLAAEKQNITAASEVSQAAAESRGDKTSDTTSPAVATAEDDTYQPLIYEGRVLTPDGKPAVGAEIWLVPHAEFKLPKSKITTTANDGRFQFEINPADLAATSDRLDSQYLFGVLAAADGYGVTWSHSLAFEKTGRLRSKLFSDEQLRQLIEGYYRMSPARFDEMLAEQQATLRLRPEQPIRGKVVDTEGNPLVGARVSVRSLRTNWDGSLDAWFTATNEPHADASSLERTAPNTVYGRTLQEFLPAAESDENGVFTLRTVGTDSLVRLLIEAPGFAKSDINVQTRNTDKVSVEFTLQQETVSWLGHTFVFVEAPSTPIRGVVRNKATGDPIAGVKVESLPFSDRGKTSGSNHVHATTDAEGRYELQGLPQAEKTIIVFNTQDLPYLSASTEVDLSGSNNQSGVIADISLMPGVRVMGRVTDQTNGKGVRGQVQYMAPNDHPKFKELGELKSYTSGSAEVDADGRFEVTVPHGPGFLTFETWDDKIEKDIPPPKNAAPISGYAFIALAGSDGPKYNAVEKLELRDDTANHVVEMKVKRAALVNGKVVDQAGQPVVGARYSGRTDVPIWHATNGDAFYVAGYQRDKPRRLTFVHRGRRLAGTLLLEGPQDKELQVQLQPWGSIHGRVVDELGEPIPNFVLFSGSMKEMMSRSDTTLPLPPQDDSQSSILMSDNEGRFRIDGLVSNVSYALAGHIESTSMSVSGDLVQGIEVAAGEDKDLGDLTLRPFDFNQLQREKEEPNKNDEAADKAQVQPAG